MICLIVVPSKGISEKNQTWNFVTLGELLLSIHFTCNKLLKIEKVKYKLKI